MLYWHGIYFMILSMLSRYIGSQCTDILAVGPMSTHFTPVAFTCVYHKSRYCPEEVWQTPLLNYWFSKEQKYSNLVILHRRTVIKMKNMNVGNESNL